MINMGELFANDRIGDICMELVPMNEKELSTMLVEPGDLLFARQSLVLSGAGKCSIVQSANEPTTFESHIIRVRLNRQIADPAFYYYYFRSPICRIRSIVTQGVQAGIRANDLKKLIVHVPDIASQQRIASILSAYDDLIENNRRRIQLLEEAARLLYREWFIHLRFPGHEHAAINDGVPEGWEKKTLGDVAPLNYGKALKQDDRVSGPFPVYGSSGIVGTHVKALVPGPTIIVGRKGNVGSVYRSSEDCHPIDTVYYIDSSRCSFHLYYALQHMSFINTDVAVPGLNRNFAHSRSILIPEQKIYRLFEDTVAPMHLQIDLLCKENVALTQARDLLLPRLMNGEIAV
ncbi:restriction endonuclease subunit S [Methanoculleus sediminis]|uniref:restriction endonuclease subunit S n=1 Tax=Methanoculleus sediminis TaxID=1550566 RepID=UPI000AB56A75|nr:restriction endonuclease subunit S [Methanoculleus sediminis]